MSQWYDSFIAWIVFLLSEPLPNIADKISHFDQQIAISKEPFDRNLTSEGNEKYSFNGLSVKVEY